MAWFKAGTVALTNGSTTATFTGAGIDFVTLNPTGFAIQLPDSRLYEVAGVIGATVLVLGEPYMGATASGQAYKLIPTASLSRDLALGVQQLIAGFAAVRDGIGQGYIEDGSAVSPGLRFANDQDTGFYRFGSDTIGLSSGGIVRMVLSPANMLLVGAIDSRRLVGGTGYAECLSLAISNNPAYTAETKLVMGQLSENTGFIETRNIGNVKGTMCLQPYGGLVVVGAPVNPISDNALALGGPSRRFSTIYAATGAINTSDERDKEWRGDLSPAELRAARTIAGGIGIYRWLDAIATKGDGARLHVGVKAQAVVAALTAEGLDPMAYGFVCHDAWAATPGTPAVPAVSARPAVIDEHGHTLSPAVEATPAHPARPPEPAGDRYGIRPDELLMFLIAAQEQRLTVLEAA